MKKSRKALLSSALSLLLCFTMLLGTTFAWFTDSVTSTNNIIKSGKLDVEMSWSDTKDGTFKDASAGAIFDYEYWEPGFTQIKYVKIDNVGNLAFRYVLNIIPNTMPAAGEANLADVIDVYLVDTSKGDITRETLAGLTPVGTLSALMADSNGAARGVMLPVEGTTNVTLNEADKTIAQTGTATYCIALKMQESAGNEYQDKTVGGGFAVQLLATQYTYENDTFGNDYDTNSAYPGMINFSASAAVTADANGTLDQGVTIGEADDINADVPAGVKLAEGATELKLSVETMIGSEANVELNNGETKQSLDIHIEGVAEDNTVPMLITLPGLLKTGLNSTSVALYHVEDGETNEMTLVTAPTDHNEFSYDPATGDVVVALQSFSEVTAVTDDWNLWKGEIDTSWYNANATEFTIETADKLAGLGKLVDEGNSFEGKIVRLGGDINLSGGYSLNPIGCGYAPETGVTNANNVTGYAFKGTFDGGIYDDGGNVTGKYTISGLYQNGWELGLSYCNLGGGLFASIADGTVKNLTISGANIVMECVEQGILVGLSQGDCTYENIDIYNSKVANYQRATGGLIGEVSPIKDENDNYYGTTTIKNVTIGPDVVVGSLWGDFDAPVGGVIGARWDDSDTTAVNMTDVTVAARLDVYNDVTSSYQWYAYRRAGMLIGNTDTPPADGKHSATATADFLTCSDVTVWYGPWVNYHYCEFSNYNSSWPWVRVEEGENCSAYSNPRYGVPNDVNGNKVVDENHEHQTGDTCMELIEFNQLYGGGQGVYGQKTHAGVTTENYKYTITYVNDGKVLDIVYVPAGNTTAVKTANSTAQALVVEWVEDNIEGKVVFGGWMNAGSTKLTEIPADNTDDIVLYPWFDSPYTASFVDQKGNILAWCFFNENDTTKLAGAKELAEDKLPTINDFEFDSWKVHVTDDEGNTTTEETYDVNKFASYTTDVTIYPVYKYNGDVSLIPVDKDGDGDTDYYQVGGYGASTGEQELVEIPGEVNGVKVTTINADAFSSYDDLHSVRIPGTITEINSQSFTANQGSSWNPKRDTVTLYYEGNPDVWKAAMEKFNAKDYSGILKGSWDNNMGDGSRVFFLDENGKVINTSYWELNSEYKWVLHEHAYTYEAAKTCAHGEKSHYEYGGGIFGFGASLQEDKFTDYAGACDCDKCNGATRPDAKYWT